MARECWTKRGGGDVVNNDVTSESERSTLPELLLPEDLPERPGMGGSGYADMGGGREDEALRDFFELEQKVDPYTFLTDVD